ncbi:MAG: hypothetical protein WA982_00080 [Rubrobacteraceae bacterium]
MVEKPGLAPASDESRPEDQRPGRNWAVAGIVFGVLAFILVPIFMGPLGILFGLIGFAKGARRLGKIAMGISVFSLVLGSVLYILLQNLMNT